jgi:uncharacterized protein YecE (DUF72 family)
MTKAGYKDWTKQVSITTGQTASVYAYFESGTGSATTRSETITATSTFGSLRVYTHLDGVSIYMNDEHGGLSWSAYNWASGVQTDGLLQGTYTLKMTKAGYKDWTKQVSITTGQTTSVYAYFESGSGSATTRSETITATSTFGSLRVYTHLDGVSIYMNDEHGGVSWSAYNWASGVQVDGLLEETYTLKMTKAGYKDWTKQVSITTGQTASVYAYFESGTGTATTRDETITATSSFGSLRVYTHLDGVSIYVNEEHGGVSWSAYNWASGVQVDGLLQGTYTLKMTKAGYKDWTKQVSITTGQTTSVYAYFEIGSGSATTRNETITATSTFGSLRVYAHLDGVSICMNSEHGGLSWSAYNWESGAQVDGLLEGTYTLKMTKAGYKDWTKQVTITTGLTTSVYAYLESGSGTATTRNETITASTGWGTLSLNTNVAGVSIWIGNASLGYEFGGLTNSSGDASVVLPAGTYTLRLTKAGYQDWTVQITVTASATTTVDATLVTV